MIELKSKTELFYKNLSILTETVRFWFTSYLISRFFMRFMASMKKMGVIISIHARLNSIVVSMFPRVRARVMVTALVRGNTKWAVVCTICGIAVKGKKVPLSRDMGVMNKKAG